VVARQGEASSSTTVTVVEPERPIVDAVEGDGSVEIAAAGFPRSAALSIGVYREPASASSAWNLVRAFSLTADARGRALVALAMPGPVPGIELYGVRTIPDSYSSADGGDAYGHLVFSWPPD
jgi:hypothetical protein